MIRLYYNYDARFLCDADARHDKTVTENLCLPYKEEAGRK